MKKKVLAFLLASTMVIEPFSVAGAADFSDGTGQEAEVQFSDDAEDVPEVENDVDGVDQFSTDAVGEGESSSKPSEDAIQMGDDVWFRFDDATGTATISGTGDMWDYYNDGWDTKKEHKNPFFDIQRSISKLVIMDGITSVGNYFLNGRSDLNELSIGKEVKRIGAYAFAYCQNISSVTFPDGLIELGKWSFCGTNISEIKIPQSIEVWGEYSFASCRNLSSISLPSTLQKIPMGCFENCSNLSKIQIPDSVSYLGESAFQNCISLVEINLPSSLNNQPYMLFSGCLRLEKVNFGEGFSSVISQRMFENCESLKNIKLVNGIKSIEANSFEGCTELTEITISQSVNRIDRTAFNECNKFKIIKGYTGSYAETFANNNGIDFESIGEVPIQPAPTGMKFKVGSNAIATVEEDTLTIAGSGETYDECYWEDIKDSMNELDKNSIKHIIVEDGITSLGYELFYNFKNVETIQLPTSLRKINDWTFQNCRSLKSILIPEGVMEIGIGIFNNCTSLKNITFPSTLKEIPNITDSEDSELVPVESITLENGIQSIGDMAFDGMSKLKSINIPSSVTTIGRATFADCTALSNISLPDTITKIEYGAFRNCESINKIILPNSLTSLEDDVFQNCNAEIIFPASLKYIPNLGINAAKKVIIPEGVEIIGSYAFEECSNLLEITLPSTITSIENGAFSDTGITTFNWPQNINSIPYSAFRNTKLKEFSVPEAVTEINESAFQGCEDLEKITIPKSVTYIGTDAFKDCRNLIIYGYKDSAAESYAKANNIKFVSADYKVIFKDNGRTQKTEYVTKGQNATPPTLPAKEGYILSWDADYTNIQEDMVINAVWTKKDNGNGGGTTIIVSPSETTKYTVTFKDRGKIVKTEKVKSGDAAEYPFITRNGYELSWDKDFSKITADTTVNAVWTVIKPDKVTSLTAEVQKNSIDLSWDRAENTDYYLVYRKATSDTEYRQIKKTTKILWTDKDVEPGTEYSYKVVGICSVDGKKYQGADSDIVTAKIGTPQIGDVYSVGNLKYKVTGAKEVSVIGLAKEAVDIKIPSAVSISGKAYKVTSIQDKAFYQNEDIVNVTIGNNVTYVGKYAFYQCPNLETVKFGKRVSTISTCAFTQCPNLENVTLPSSIRKIGAKAFYQCTSIKTLKINGSALEYVGKKGLAVNKSVTVKLPKKYYSKYQKLIKASSVYSKTKYTKF